MSDKTIGDVAEEATRKACAMIALVMDIRGFPKEAVAIKRFTKTLAALVRADYEKPVVQRRRMRREGK